jgi:hypothetical protein
MLRDHGPNDPGFLLVMLVLATYMDRHGFAFPGQPTWAKAARRSVRMLQRYIARGRTLGWLEVVNAGRSGKGWAFNGYRCCVPDGIELDEKDESIAEAIIAEAGDVDGDDTMMSLPQVSRSDIAMSSPAGKPSSKPSGTPSPDVPRLDGDDMARTMVTTSGTFGDDISGNLVATQLWRTNSCSENSHSENSRESLKVGLTPTALPSVPDLEAKGKAKAAEQDERKHASITKLLKAGIEDHQIVTMLKRSQGVTADDVRRMRLESA